MINKTALLRGILVGLGSYLTVELFTHDLFKESERKQK